MTQHLDDAGTAPRRQLSLLDTTSIIVGIIIGSGLYRTSPDIAANVASPAVLLAVWTLGGVIALVGASCYAELATAYPEEGGDFVYLSRAFGRRVGFVYAWCQLWVVRPGSIGFISLVFAEYAQQIVPAGRWATVVYATGAVILLAWVNMLGVRQGKITQNILTAVKVVGLLTIVSVGLGMPAPEPLVQTAGNATTNWSLALILVLFTYSGWNEMPNVAAEVRDPRRNILRALVLGTGAVVAIYLLVNAAFLRALGFEGMQHSEAVAADVAAKAWGPWAARSVSLLICLSALGAMNGMTMTGSRLYYAFGLQHPMFAWLGRWHPRLGTPVASLATEAAITATTIVALSAIYGADRNVFQQFVTFTAPMFWAFLGLSVASLLVLRRRDPQRERPFRVPLYPITPLLFCGVCGYMLYAGLTYAWSQQSWEALWALGLLGVGIVLALAERREDAAAKR